jgi:glycosyltransferase involved in cell wall biosynthesis
VKYFAREILPIVRRSLPEAQFYIVGSNPSRSVKRLAHLPGVIVTGTVQNVRPYLERARVAAVPIRISQGIQNKILEALASGLPVVTTPAAVAGLKHPSNLPIAVANDAKEFAHSVLKFLSAGPLPPERLSACRESLKKDYDWDSNLAAFDIIFQKICAPGFEREPLAAMESDY